MKKYMAPSFHPDVKRLIQRFERIKYKTSKNDVWVLFN